MYLTGGSSRKCLRGPRIIRSARAANGEREAVSGSNGVGIGRGVGKDDAVNLRVRRNGNGGGIQKPNVAMSAGPLGTPSGVQFTGVFQSPEMGSRSIGC